MHWPSRNSLCLDRTKTTLKSGLEGGSKVPPPLLPWLMPQLHHWPRRNSLCSTEPKHHPQSASKEEASSHAHFCRG
ncbi:hypothetical protein TYRP_022435 [Tyrophagus putrescentiae]|nr:hypothetical protein TYRP_022435 [Tyrophagus putrescentiae]